MLRTFPLAAVLAVLAGSCVEGPPPPRSEYTLESLPATPPGTTIDESAGRGGRRAVAVVGRADTESVGREPQHASASRIVLQHDTGGPYIFNAKFEPPRGRIIHGMGQWVEGNSAYLHMLDDPDIMPASELAFVIVGDWPRPWESRLGQFREMLEADLAQGRFPSADLTLYGLDPVTREKQGVDADIANTDKYDQRLRAIAQLVGGLRGPVLLRVGGEFSGEWSHYTPYEYPKAFRKIVKLFREEGADNVAFVWCYEPSAPDDFDVRDGNGWRWFPGDDVIDWFGLDVFNADEFAQSTDRRGNSQKFERAERFLKMARDHGKPVSITESSAVKVDITPDLMDGRRDWDAWFAPYFAFLERHPEIEAFHYLNTDWSKNGSYAALGWLDARLELNSYISRKWIEELRKPRYLHAKDTPLLNGYAEACAPRPESRTPPAVPAEDNAAIEAKPVDPRRGGGGKAPGPNR